MKHNRDLFILYTNQCSGILVSLNLPKKCVFLIFFQELLLMTVMYLVNSGPESMQITFVLHVIWLLVAVFACFMFYLVPSFSFQTRLLSFTNRNLPFPSCHCVWSAYMTCKCNYYSRKLNLLTLNKIPYNFYLIKVINNKFVSHILHDFQFYAQ